MNYMDYTTTNCKNMFTTGQGDRMLAALLNERDTILTSAACGSVGIDEAMTPTIRMLFPNPAISSFSLDGLENVVDITRFDAQGRKTASLKPVGAQVMLNSVPAGTYVVALRTDKNTVYARLVVGTAE
ncbi:MAG: T9SS type A sorting domain-containing protein [Flavobacteriales bacterium]|nr:T9SS type A sorting domain-containing protein [Flavobacteriales bacterium]